MKCFSLTKQRPSAAALAIAALLLSSPDAFAQSFETSSDLSGEASSDDLSADASAGQEETPPEATEEPSPEEPKEAEEATAEAEEPAAAEPAISEKSKEPTKKPYVGFAPPLNPAKIENESVSLRLGLFVQPQFEMAGAPDANKTAKNLYLRNVGVIISGTLFKHFEYFFDVNYPNLFKADPLNQTGGTSKNAPGLNVQDAIVTFKPFGHTAHPNVLKFDAGFMLPALSHNALQSSFTLYGYDHFVNAFRRNVLTNADPFKSNGQSPQGRDAGAQVRGLLLGDHLEYRVGLFQGLRVGPLPASQGMEAEVGSVNFFRVAARLQVNILDAETDYLYRGTYLGEKKILSFGAYYDFQDQYVSAGGDFFLDLPVGPGLITAQANVMFWDGGAFIQTLPQQLAVMAEAGYLIRSLMLSPIVRIEYLNPSERTASTPSEGRYGGGLAFWPWGHTSNLKAFYSYVVRDPAPEPFSQFNLQWQVWF